MTRSTTTCSTTARLGRVIVMMMVAACGTLAAQGPDLNPHPSGDGLAAANRAAATALGADARLVLIGAIGNGVYDTGSGTVQLRFDAADGTSTAWAFAYYSPSKGSHVMLAAVDIPGLGFQIVPTSAPVPLDGIRDRVDPALPFGGSETIVGRLATDSTYRRYRAELPGVYPADIAYRAVNGRDSALLPAWFPRNTPVWMMRFTGAGDSTMNCWVSGGTGAVYVVRGGVAAVPNRGATGRRPDLSDRSTGGAVERRVVRVIRP